MLRTQLEASWATPPSTQDQQEHVSSVPVTCPLSFPNLLVTQMGQSDVVWLQAHIPRGFYDETEPGKRLQKTIGKLGSSGWRKSDWTACCNFLCRLSGPGVSVFAIIPQISHTRRSSCAGSKAQQGSRIPRQNTAIRRQIMRLGPEFL